MIPLLLIGAPMLAGVAMYPLQRRPRLAAWLTLAVLAGLAVLAALFPVSSPLRLLGRSLQMSADRSLYLAIIGATLALAVLYSSTHGPQPMVYGLLLGAVSLFAASILMDSLTITALALQLGAILAAMLISEQPGAAMVGVRTLVLFVIAGALLLMAGWATGGQSSSVNPVTLTYIVGICVTVSVSLYLAIFPFHIWLPPAYRGATIVGVMLMVVVSTATLAQLSSILDTNLWPGGRSFFGLVLVLAGLANAVWGGVGAFVQRSLRRVLAYAAMADLGIVLIGIGLDTTTSQSVAMLHLIYRALAVTLVAVAIQVLLRRMDTDDLSDLRGAWQWAPQAVIGFLVGGLSLAGLPPMAAFADRFAIYQALAGQHSGWVVPVVLTSVGPAWAFMRATATALMPPDDEKPPHAPGNRSVEWLIVGALSLVLILPSLFPSLLSLLPPAWYELIMQHGSTLLGG